MKTKSILQTAAVCLMGFASAIAATKEQQSKITELAADSITVRPLGLKPGDPNFHVEWGGKGKVTLFEDAAAVEKAFGPEFATKLLKHIDFTKEKIVLVSWNTSGLPEGWLKHEVKGSAKSSQITYYVQSPDLEEGQRRGERGLLGADFFGVPKDMSVAFDSVERK